jgi:hypothetical protein
MEFSELEMLLIIYASLATAGYVPPYMSDENLGVPELRIALAVCIVSLKQQRDYKLRDVAMRLPSKKLVGEGEGERILAVISTPTLLLASGTSLLHYTMPAHWAEILSRAFVPDTVTETHLHRGSQSRRHFQTWPWAWVTHELRK